MDTKQGWRPRLFTLAVAAAAGAAARLSGRRVQGCRSSCERCRHRARTKRARGRCPPASGALQAPAMARRQDPPGDGARTRGERCRA
jgi:hypothetical protein